jgi:hypothetical protein
MHGCSYFHILQRYIEISHIINTEYIDLQLKHISTVLLIWPSYAAVNIQSPNSETIQTYDIFFVSTF